MDKKEQIKRVRQGDRELRKLIEESLTGPKGKQNAALWKKLAAEAKEEGKNDHAIYRIRIWNFREKHWYEAELTNLKHEVAGIEGIEITNVDSDRLICLSFLTRKALKKFREDVDIGSMGEDSFEFSEHRRNRKGLWVFVMKPILWDEDRLR